MEAQAVTEPVIDPSSLKACPLSTDILVDRCLTFCEALSGVGFYNYERVFARRVIESVLSRDGEVITALWSRQSGKTETVADVSIGLAVILPVLAKAFPDDERLKPFDRGFKVGIFAPILDQATTCYNRMREKIESAGAEEILKDPEIGLQVTQNRGDTCAFSNGSFVRARSASEDSQIEGGTYHLIILEEAQKLSRSKVNKEISPMLASTNGTMVKIGTAFMSKGGFHTTIQTNLEQFARGGKRNHFEFPYDLVMREKKMKYEQEVKESGTGNAFHLNYENWITKEIKRLGGIDSDEFKMNFRLMWQETRLAAVRSDRFAAAAMDGQSGRILMERGSRVLPGWAVVAGLDVGKSTDSSVLTIGQVDPNPIIIDADFELRKPSEDEEDPEKEGKKLIVHDKRILDWLELGGAFEGDEGQYQQVKDFLRMFPSLRVLAVDSTGIGDPVCERLQVLLYPVMVIPVRFNLQSKHLLYRNYLRELHSGRLKYPAGPVAAETIEYSKFQSEHMDLDKKIVQGYTIVSHSDEAGHDDYPDSSALMCWAEKELANVPQMAEVEVSDDSPFQRVAAGRSSRYIRRR